MKEHVMIDRLKINLSEDEENELKQWINQHRYSIEEDREPFLSRIQKFMYNWDDFVTYNRKGPWEGSSNFHMPLTAIMVKSIHSRFYNIFSQSDTTILTPREYTDEAGVKLARRLREWYVNDCINESRGIRGFAREVFYDAVTIGFGVGMKDFYVKNRKYIDLEEIDEKELAKEMQDLEPQVNEAQNEINAKEGLLTTEEEERVRVNTNKYREVEKIKKVFEGSRIRTVPFEDIYFPNSIYESSNLDEPECVIVETQMSLSDIYAGVENGQWSKEKADAIKQEGYKGFTDTRAQNVKEQRGNLTGYDETNSNYSTDMRTIQYCFCTYDLPQNGQKDGISEEIVVMMSSGGTILDISWLDRLTKLGSRPLFKFDCFAKPRQSYARGVPEYMYPLNDEIDELHNTKIDALKLQTCPFGAYRSQSSLKKQPIKIGPGKFIPVDEITDLTVLNFPLNANALSGEEGTLFNYAERLIATSSLQQGIVPSTVGPTRSTSGVLALLQQMDKEFKVSVDQCAEQWKKLEKFLIEDLDDRIAPETKLRVLGSSINDFIKEGIEDISKINKSMSLKNLVDMKIDVADVIESEQMKRNTAMLILGQVSAPSLAHQSGIIGPNTLYKAWARFYESYGIDPSQELNEPEMDIKPMTLFQEIQVIGQGQIPKLSMQDDHFMKANMLRNFMQTPEYAQMKETGMYIPNLDEMMMKAIDAHLRLGQALQPKGLPNPNGENQMDLNAVLAGQGANQGEENAKIERGGNRPKPQVPNESAGMEQPSDSSELS